jgi:lipopolysaccharide export system protein LptA
VTGRIVQRRRIALLVAAIAATTLVVVTQGVAQPERGASGLFKSSRQSRDEPIRITAASFEVRDKSKLATFSGNVHVIQGALNLQSNTLVVFYEEAAGVKKVADSDRSQQQIRRVEVRGSVVVTQKDQRATADQADFDMRDNLLTLNGSVVVVSCENVMRGERLIVDLTTGISRMEGRVAGVLDPKSRGGAC